MIRYALQFTRGPLPAGVDENDLDWTDVNGHQDYTSWSVADDARKEFDAAFEFGYVHRVEEREVDAPELVKVLPEFEALRLALTGRA